jgi:hypothetical protein
MDRPVHDDITQNSWTTRKSHRKYIIHATSDNSGVSQGTTPKAIQLKLDIGNGSNQKIPHTML